jgi:hypothetical protein
MHLVAEVPCLCLAGLSGADKQKLLESCTAPLQCMLPGPGPHGRRSTAQPEIDLLRQACSLSVTLVALQHPGKPCTPLG